MFVNHPLSRKGIDEKIQLIIELASLSMPNEQAVVLLADVENQIDKYDDLVWLVYTWHYKYGSSISAIKRSSGYPIKELENAQDTIRRIVACLMLNW